MDNIAAYGDVDWEMEEDEDEVTATNNTVSCRKPSRLPTDISSLLVIQILIAKPTVSPPNMIHDLLQGITADDLMDIDFDEEGNKEAGQSWGEGE